MVAGIPEREALLGDEILALSRTCDALSAELDRARADITALTASRSWRLTGPLRALGRRLKRRS